MDTASQPFRGRGLPPTNFYILVTNVFLITLTINFCLFESCVLVLRWKSRKAKYTFVTTFFIWLSDSGKIKILALIRKKMLRL